MCCASSWNAQAAGLAVIFITHNVMHAMAVGDHFARADPGALAADFRKGEKTREEITDLMAGGESMADLEAEVRKLHGDPRRASAAAARSTDRALHGDPTPFLPGSAPARHIPQQRCPEAARSSVMKIALDPFMHRHLSLEELPSKVAELGYEWIELSPRADFLEWFKAPRVFPDRIKAFKKALSDANVGIASLLPMYRWASNDEDERQAAVKHWKRAIEIAVELGVDTMNSEFGRGPHPDKGSCYCCHTGSMIEACEDAWWRSMEELVPVFEREGINLHVEPHPEDWCETLQPAVDIIRTVNSKNVKFLYCAPHTFYFGDDTKAMLRECADVLAHVHVGDTFNHKASSGLRYILNPPGTQARVHQHLNIGQGEVPWDDFFGTLPRSASTAS